MVNVPSGTLKKKEQEKDTSSLGSNRLFKLYSFYFTLQVFIKIEDLKSLHNLSVHSFGCQFYSLWHAAGSAVGLWQGESKMWLILLSEQNLNVWFKDV